jgi:hypothetical protein
MISHDHDHQSGSALSGRSAAKEHARVIVALIHLIAPPNSRPLPAAMRALEGLKRSKRSRTRS